MHRAVRTMTRVASGLLFGTKIKEYAGHDPNMTGNLFAVYVHYDAYGLIHRYVIEQVAALAKAGFRVIFVSNAPRLQLNDALLPHCVTVVHRRNLGHDFGAYRDGLRWILAHKYQPRAVLLMNDSCYGFFSSVERIERNVCDGEADLWGLTESYEHYYHLQSYFLLVSQKLFNAPAFWNFWNSLPVHRSREQIIQQCEIGLSQVVLRHGFRLRSHVNYQEAAQLWLDESLPRFGKARTEKRFVKHVQDALITSRPLNPSHYFWELLLSRYRVPLIKRDLIGRNPEAVPGAHRIASAVIEQGGDFSAALEHIRFRASHDGILPLL